MTPTHVVTEEDFIALIEAKDHHPQHHTRLSVTLNIGHDGNPYTIDSTDTLRAIDYAALLRRLLKAENLPPVKDTSLLLTVRQSDTEVTDVVTFDVNAVSPSGYPGYLPNHHALIQAFSRLAHALATLTSQEAVALRWIDTGARDAARAEQGGVIAGPKAWAWGVFDRSKFLDYIDSPFHTGTRL